MKKPEHILCAAIHFDDGQVRIHQPRNVTSGFVVTGRRHHNCFGTLVALGVLDRVIDRKTKGITEVQGFLTSHDRFVDRTEAATVALAAGQIDKPAESLLSEDLW